MNLQSPERKFRIVDSSVVSTSASVLKCITPQTVCMFFLKMVFAFTTPNNKCLVLSGCYYPGLVKLVLDLYFEDVTKTI